MNEEKKLRREILAAVALHGLMANPSEVNTSPTWPQAYARCAVQAADALLEELDKEPAKEIL